MDCQSCQRIPASLEGGCPPRMADGRAFTDYRTRCLQDQYVQTQSKAPSSYDYRQFLIQNAASLMDKERMALFSANGCQPCYPTTQTGTMLPEQSVQECDSRSCTFQAGAADGLGTGRRAGPARPAPGNPAGSTFYPVQGRPVSDEDQWGQLL